MGPFKAYFQRGHKGIFSFEPIIIARLMKTILVQTDVEGLPKRRDLRFPHLYAAISLLDADASSLLLQTFGKLNNCL
jgi:hypothetical protein